MKSPPVVMVPQLLLHVNVGCVCMRWLNWSYPCAVNCCVAPVETDAVPGVTTMLVRVAVTVTLLTNVTFGSPVTLAVNVYAPAEVKVNVATPAEVVKVGAEAPLGSVALQVIAGWVARTFPN